VAVVVAVFKFLVPVSVLKQLPVVVLVVLTQQAVLAEQ
jgi:hypothetical protein